LVEAREKAKETARALPKDQQKAFWTSYRVTCHKIIAESGLNWECGPEILERFETACRMAARGERGWPKRQEEVLSVVIPHYFACGRTLGLGVILLVQLAFAAGGVAVFLDDGLNPEVIDVFVGGAGATLVFFGLSALHAEWRLRGAIPALLVRMRKRTFLMERRQSGLRLQLIDPTYRC
jgi:hypothetical protein